MNQFPQPWKGKHSRFYYFTYKTTDGRRLHKSTRCTTKYEARRYIEQFINNITPLDEPVYFIKIDDRKQGIYFSSWMRGQWEYFSPRERLACVFVFYKGICAYCGKRVKLGDRYVKINDRASLDHKIPIIGGGIDSFDNAVLACQKCNSAKGSMDYHRFINVIKKQNGTGELPSGMAN